MQMKLWHAPLIALAATVVAGGATAAHLMREPSLSSLPEPSFPSLPEPSFASFRERKSLCAKAYVGLGLDECLIEWEKIRLADCNKAKTESHQACVADRANLEALYVNKLSARGELISKLNTTPEAFEQAIDQQPS